MKLKWEEGGLCGGENEDIETNMRIKLKLKIPIPIHDSFRLSLL